MVNIFEESFKFRPAGGGAKIFKHRSPTIESDSMIFPRKAENMDDIKKAVSQDEEDVISITPDQSAPLFVKIEKYRELVKNVQELRTFVSGTKQAFTILNEIENIRKDTLNILRTTVQRLEKRLAELDSMMLRPRGIPFEPHEVEEVGHVEDGLMDLQKQISALRNELQTLQ